MLNLKNIYIFLLVISFTTFNANKLIPTILLNVTIFKDLINNKLHIFLIRGELRYTDRSIQYYFFDNLQFAHTSIHTHNLLLFDDSIEDLSKLISNISSNTTKMNKIRELTNLRIKPIILSFIDKSNKNNDTITGLKAFEEAIFKTKIQTKHKNKKLFFTLYGNHFRESNKCIESVDTNNTLNSQISVSINIVRSSNDINTNKPSSFTPVSFSLNNSFDTHSIEEQENNNIVYNFANYDGNWEVIEHSGYLNSIFLIVNNPIEENETLYSLIRQLEKFFETNTKYSKSKIAPKTYFSPDLYNSAFKNIINKTEFTKLQELYSVNNNLKEYTFKVLNESKIDKEMRNKYYVLGEIKESFEDNVLFTNTDLFDNKQITNGNLEGIKSNKRKKNEINYLYYLFILWIILIIVFLGVFKVLKKYSMMTQKMKKKIS